MRFRAYGKKMPCLKKTITVPTEKIYSPYEKDL